MKHHVLTRTFGVTLLTGLFALNPLQSALAQVESDDFNDGNDTGWQRYNPLSPFGLNATYTFPNGGYRLQTRYVTGQAVNPGRAGTTRPQVYSGNFYVSVDVVAWDHTLRQSFGLLARVSSPGLQTTLGYAFTWDRGNTNSLTNGDVDISRIDNEAPFEVVVNGPDRLALTPGEKYRFVFIGRGPTLEGRVYQHPDLDTPLITVSGTDATYASGMNGMVVFDNTGGNGFTDTTFDNYFATDIEPPRLRIGVPDFGYRELSWPQEASMYALQTSTVLPGTATDWTDVPSLDVFEPTLENPRYRYNMAVESDVGGLPQQFFRLVRRPAQ